MNVLIVVDMQNDFIDGALGTAEARAIVPAVAARIAQARAAGDTVIFTRDTHGEDYLNTQEGRNLPVPHCLKGSFGWEISAALPVEDAPVVDKPSFGSCELAAMLTGLSPDAVELIGVCTDICVISNALIVKAHLPEVPMCVRASCCAGVTPESHENALKAMKACQIDII